MKKTVALLLSLLMLLSLLAGCASEPASTTPTTTEDAPATTDTPAETPAEDPADEPADEPAEAPVEEPTDEPVEAPAETTNVMPICDPGEITLSYWLPTFSQNLAMFVDLSAESNAQRKAEEITGVHIDFTAVNSETAPELYPLMIASEDWTDMINYAYLNGGDAAIDDEVYLRLNELIDSYAPNYKATIEQDAYRRDVKTDSGNIWAFYCVYEATKTPTGGLAWRSDIAAEHGWTEQPTTLAEFEAFLADMKNAGYEGFFSIPTFGYTTGFGGGMLPPSWNTSTTFFNQDGTAVFGPVTEEYREYVTDMAEWYAAGYIDREFTSGIGGPDNWNRLATGELIIGTGVSGIMGRGWFDMAAGADENGYLAAMGAINYDENTPVRIGNKSELITSPVALSGTCSNPEAAARWLDFWFSEEGILLKNYGVEGETFEFDANGQPQYTDLINKHPDGHAKASTMQVLCFTNGPGYTYTLYETEDVMKACEIWGTISSEWNLPANISMTVEENSVYSSIMADITTACEEATAKFITGERPLSEFDDFVAQLKQIGIDEATASVQAALTRYLAR